MVKGLVLYDYDGTLVDERDAIYVPSNITKKTISRLQDMGYLCVLATGRALSYIPSGAKDLHLDGYVTWITFSFRKTILSSIRICSRCMDVFLR